jgi:hypothetical protein
MNAIINLIGIIFFSVKMVSSTTTVEPVKPVNKSEISKPQKIQKISNNITPQIQHLSQVAPKLNKKVLSLALNAYQKASAKGAVKNPKLTVIDYSLPSSKQRMWIFDLKKEKLLYNTHVAHGQNSGMNVPKHFSNRPSSKATSLGTYLTRGTYFGSKGLSLNLQGLEKGFNDNAYSRRVVIHGAWYVEPGFIKRAGRAGRSWGCPSIAKTIAKPVINLIKGGSVVFAYYPDKKYLSKSRYVG